MTNATTTTGLASKWAANSTKNARPQMAGCFALPLPLCAGYFGVMLDSLNVHVLGDEEAVVHSVRWAVGLLPDSELEVAGAWSTPRDHTRTWRRLFADLKDRGVEAIGFVISSDPTMTRVDAVPTYPRVKVLPSFEALLRDTLPPVPARDRPAITGALDRICEANSVASAREALDAFAAGPLGTKSPALVARWGAALEQLAPFYALPGRLRRHIRSGERVVQRLHQTLARAIERHGVFADGQGALSFVHAVLRRSERRLEGWAERPAVANGRRFARSRAGAAAPEF